MRIPSIAILCCCCCTHALLAKSELDEFDHIHDGFAPEYYQTESSSKNRHLNRRDDERGHDDDHDDHENHGDHDDHDDHDSHSHIDDDPETSTPTNENSSWTTAKKWGYATLANSILVCLSLLGIFIVKCSSSKNRLFVGDVFLGLAVSTMLGDSILHILPAVLGLHNHEDNDHDDHGNHDDHSDSEHDDTEYYTIVGKLGTLVGAMYLFWIIESFMTILGRGHSHSHGSDHESLLSSSGELSSSVTTSSTSNPHTDHQEVEVAQIHPTKNTEIESRDQAHGTHSSPRWPVIFGILVGDCFHNIVDGIAVGVAWSQSPGSGIGTTIAIAMHELPHELGDFIVYKKLGLKTRQAIGLNLFAALLSFGGLYTGIGLASNPAVTSWLLAIVAGLFIYISMVDVMPEMKLSKSTPNKFLRFGLQNVGMVIGFTIMVLLSVFEDDLMNLK